MDAADAEKFETAKKELQELLLKPPLEHIPLLVLANKNDLPAAVGVEAIIEKLCVPLFRPIACPYQTLQGPEEPCWSRGLLLQHLGQEPGQHRRGPGLADQARAQRSLAPV